MAQTLFEEKIIAFEQEENTLLPRQCKNASRYGRNEQIMLRNGPSSRIVLSTNNCSMLPNNLGERDFVATMEHTAQPNSYFEELDKSNHLHGII